MNFIHWFWDCGGCDYKDFYVAHDGFIHCGEPSLDRQCEADYVALLQSENAGLKADVNLLELYLKNTREDVIRLKAQVEKIRCCENCRHEIHDGYTSRCEQYDCIIRILENSVFTPKGE